MRLGSVGSILIDSSNPVPPIPAIIGWPNVGVLAGKKTAFELAERYWLLFGWRCLEANESRSVRSTGPPVSETSTARLKRVSAAAIAQNIKANATRTFRRTKTGTRFIGFASAGFQIHHPIKDRPRQH